MIDGGAANLIREFGYSPLAPAIWVPGDEHVVARDLGLSQSSGQRFHGTHLKTTGRAATVTQAIPHGESFGFIFVLSGTVDVMERGKTVHLAALSSATRAGKIDQTELRLSHDAEIILLEGCGKAFASSDDQTGWVVNNDEEASYELGQGPRSFFEYRDLGTAALTGREIHIHVVRATKAAALGGTGWHHHSMSQIFYVLRGAADLLVRGRPFVRMVTGDAMCLAAGMQHDVPSFSEDYLVLEMCLPADYTTVAAEPDSGP